MDDGMLTEGRCWALVIHEFLLSGCDQIHIGGHFLFWDSWVPKQSPSCWIFENDQIHGTRVLFNISYAVRWTPMFLAECC